MTWTPSSKPCTETNAHIEPIRTLLATAVDHAGLFPPAGLNMSAAVAAFHQHGQSEHAWMLGSFVVPAGRLEQLAEAHAAVAAPDEDPWPLSVIVVSPEEGAEAMELVRRRLAEGLRVAAFEVRALGAQTIREKHEHLSGPDFEGVHVYYEVPLDERTEARLDAVAAVGAHAKVRTGGVTAEAFPGAGELVRFMRACTEREVAFKATAGLHHAFMGSYPLTYETGSACAGMHGFLGLALTAGLIRAGAVDDAGAVASLAGGAPDLEVLDDGFSWCGHHLTHDDLVDLRRDFFRSFGSCSFAEPLEELRRAGLLGPGRSQVPQ
jgi:hypothetical protein